MYAWLDGLTVFVGLLGATAGVVIFGRLLGLRGSDDFVRAWLVSVAVAVVLVSTFFWVATMWTYG